MGTSLYDEYLREQQQPKPVGPRRDLAPPPARSRYDEYMAEQHAPAPPRASLLTRTLDAGKALGRQVIDHPVETAKGIGRGLLTNVVDAGSIVSNPMEAAVRFSREAEGDPMKMGARIGGAASLALPVVGRAAGLGATTIAGLDFAASAGLGAAQTPDDPGVGAILGLAMNAVPYAPSAVRKLTGYEPVGPQLGPRAPVRRTVSPPALPNGKQGPPVQINNVMPLPVIDRIGTPPTMRTQFDTPRETPLPATTERFPEGYSAAPTPPPVAAGALDRVYPDVTKILANGPKADDAFDLPRGLAGTTDRFPDGYRAAPNPSVVPRGALDRVFPEVAKLVDAQSAQLAGRLDDVAVPPNPTPFPASNRTFREGFQTPDSNRPAMAVPQGDLPAKLFEADTPADAAGAAAGKAAADGPITGESLNPALDAAVKTWRAAKLRDAEVQRRFGVVQQFQAALDATNGNVAVAMDAVDSNKDRGLIRLMMGETPKAPPRAVLKAGEAPIVPGNPEGTTKLSGGKSKDYRGFTDEQLAAELRRNHERVAEGMDMVARGQWVRDLDDGVGGVVSGQTREAGRGKSQINQATPLLDAAERELRVRYQRQGLGGQELEDALIAARFGEPMPAPRAAANPDDYATTGNTDFDFGDNVVAKPLAPPPVAPVIPAVPPAAPVAPVGTPAPVAGTVAAPPVTTPAGFAVAAPFVDARPIMAPSKDGAINFRTWFDQNQPGAQSAEKIMQDMVDANQPAIKAARGYESVAGTMARANAAATDFFKSLVDDPKNALDYAGIRAFAERHGEAGVPALKQAIARTASVMSDAAKAIADPTTSADDLVLAHRVVDSAFQTQDQLLGGVLNEQARIGRSMNALKIQAKLSVDPDVWMVHAKRALGDAPMTDDVMANVRRLAREAADACGGG
jgi:hypothetical protein